jgi:tetratricopeptide (TPR) repeat protein
LGEYESALEFLNSALKIRKDYWGEIHPDTADSYCSVGGVYFSMGDYEKALWHFKKSGKIRKQIDGHPDIADIYGNIGMICEDKGHLKCALKFYIKTYGIYVETIGEKHPKTKDCLRILQEAYEKIRNPQPFEEYLKEQIK